MACAKAKKQSIEIAEFGGSAKFVLLNTHHV